MKLAWTPQTRNYGNWKSQVPKALAIEMTVREARLTWHRRIHEPDPQTRMALGMTTDALMRCARLFKASS